MSVSSQMYSQVPIVLLWPTKVILPFLFILQQEEMMGFPWSLTAHQMERKQPRQHFMVTRTAKIVIIQKYFSLQRLP